MQYVRVNGHEYRCEVCNHRESFVTVGEYCRGCGGKVDGVRDDFPSDRKYDLGQWEAFTEDGMSIEEIFCCADAAKNVLNAAGELLVEAADFDARDFLDLSLDEAALQASQERVVDDALTVVQWAVNLLWMCGYAAHGQSPRSIAPAKALNRSRYKGLGLL